MSYLCRELKNNAVVSDKPLVYQEPADFSALPLLPPGGIISEANKIAAIRGESAFCLKSAKANKENIQKIFNLSGGSGSVVESAQAQGRGHPTGPGRPRPTTVETAPTSLRSRRT